MGEDGGERAATNVLQILNELMTNINVAIAKHQRMKEVEARKDAARKRRENARVNSTGKKKTMDKKPSMPSSLSRRALFKDDKEEPTMSDTNVSTEETKEKVVDPRQALLQSIQKRKVDTNVSTEETKEKVVDPRQALLQSIQKRKEVNDSSSCATTSEVVVPGQEHQEISNSSPNEITQTRDPRQALLQAIKKRKETSNATSNASSDIISNATDPRQALHHSILQKKSNVDLPSDTTNDESCRETSITSSPQNSDDNPRNNLLMAIRRKATQSESLSGSPPSNDQTEKQKSQKLRITYPYDEDSDSSSVISNSSTSASDFLSVKGCGIIADWTTRTDSDEKQKKLTRKKKRKKKRFSGDVAAAAAAAIAAAQAALKDEKRTSTSHTNIGNGIVNSVAEEAAIAAAKASLESKQKLGDCDNLDESKE